VVLNELQQQQQQQQRQQHGRVLRKEALKL
jgi:hypothetical protein